MVSLQTAINEINTGAIEFMGDDACTTEGEVVIYLKQLLEYKSLGLTPDQIRKLINPLKKYYELEFAKGSLTITHRAFPYALPRTVNRPATKRLCS